MNSKKIEKLNIFINSKLGLVVLATLCSLFVYWLVQGVLSDLYGYYTCESVFGMGSDLKGCFQRLSNLDLTNLDLYKEKISIAARGVIILKALIVIIFILVSASFYFLFKYLAPRNS